jgi:hypothetical protein
METVTAADYTVELTLNQQQSQYFKNNSESSVGFFLKE